MIPTVPADKMAHYAIGLTLGQAAIFIGWWALLIVAILALLKEAWDHSHPPHKAELMDIVAICIGGVIPMLAILARAHHV